MPETMLRQLLVLYTPRRMWPSIRVSMWTESLGKPETMSCLWQTSDWSMVVITLFLTNKENGYYAPLHIIMLMMGWYEARSSSHL